MKALLLAMPLALVLFAAAPLAAAARDGAAPEPDRVVLRLSAEGWVDTATARLVLTADAAATGEDGGADIRGRVLAAIDEVVPGGAWHLTRVARSQDQAGLERWHIVAETRRPEGALAGVHERARKSSRPGLQIRVVGVHFTPTLAEREDVLARLRQGIHERVKAELARVRNLHPERTFRVRLVDFVGTAVSPPEPVRRLMAAQEGAVAAQAPAMSVSQRLRLDATVVLAAD